MSSKESIKKKLFKNIVHYGVLYGKIDDDGEETVYLRKVFQNYDESIDYVEEYVKSFIVSKCGSEWYSAHSNDCVSKSDVEAANRVDGYYLVKNNNSWSVYKVFTNTVEGYMGTYANKMNKHVFNIYIAKEGANLTTLTKDYCEHDELVNEIKLKMSKV